MGKPLENEVVLRTRAKEVRSLIIEEQAIDKAIEIIKQHEEILTFDYGRSKYLSLLPTIRLEKGLTNKYYLLERVCQAAVQIYINNKNYDELVFFAAASCDVTTLRQSMKAIPEENRNKTREGDTILLFFVKFANLANPEYIETLKILVNDFKLSVNHADYKDHSPLIILLSKYDSLQTKGITKYNEVILNATSIILSRSNVDLLSHKLKDKNVYDIIEHYNLTDTLELLKLKNKHLSRIKSEREDERNILFSLLAQKKENEFLKIVKTMISEENVLDIEDGNNTLLQLACEKNLRTVTTYLIEKGADISKTTKRNSKTPLEITARRNFYAIFKDLLNTQKLVIDLKLFTIFLLNRGRQIKTKYFDEILCYNGTQVDIKYENGNTPLHYAIIFSNTDAILKLLKRGASLLVKNNSGKAPLDYISADDLKLYLDQCLVLDNHNKTYSKKYEMRLNFSGLLETNPHKTDLNSEVDIITKIVSSKRLQCLSNHPLILAYMETKWHAVSPFYNNILKVYGFFFVYYFILAICIGHMTLLFFLTTSFLVVLTLQPIINLKNRKKYFIISVYVSFMFLVYYLIENKYISIGIFMVALLHQFLKQHLYFSKYQARLISGIRKATPHILVLLGLYYISDTENFRNSKILLPLIIYMLIVTYSFNILVDSVGDLEHSFKSLYNKDTLYFIKFNEMLYRKYSSILSSPFIKEYVKTPTKNNKGYNYFLNYYLNRNKFVNEKFHFVKLDAGTAKKLQDFANRVSQGAKQINNTT